MNRNVTTPEGGPPADRRTGCHTKPTTTQQTATDFRDSQCHADGVGWLAYEADIIDSQTRTGWSVVVTGRAHTLTDPDEVMRYEQLLEPWVNHADTVVAIEPEIITGLRLIATEA